ncbi:hypothetical protein [Nocardia sp. NBC_01377]|uniref:hypothetical protein n=1 Tax=Nocardia sp. NBC_01377 TaxID=2903595 RepID=UPI0038651CC3
MAEDAVPATPGVPEAPRPGAAVFGEPDPAGVPEIPGPGDAEFPRDPSPVRVGF